MSDWEYGEGHLSINSAENDILRAARRAQEKYGLTNDAIALALARAAVAERPPHEQDQKGLPSRHALAPS